MKRRSGFFLVVISLSIFATERSSSAQSCAQQVRQEFNNVQDTSGNPGLDSDFIRHISAIGGMFGVHPGFFVGEETSSINAIAFPCSVIPGTRGTVVFGKKLIINQFQNTGPANVSITAIVAHEFAHVAQRERESNLRGSSKELQADYLAGWFIAKTSEAFATRQFIINQTIAAFNALGDKTSGNSDPHGSGQERVQAVMAGMGNYRSDFDSAYSASDTLFGGHVSNGRGSSSEPRSAPVETSGHNGSAQTDMESAVLRIAAMTRNGQLAQLKAGEKDDHGVYPSKLNLPGATECHLRGSASMKGGYSYDCTFNVGDRDEAKNITDEIALALNNVADLEDKSSLGTTLSKRFAFPDHSQIKISFTSSSGESFVSFHAWPTTQ